MSQTNQLNRVKKGRRMEFNISTVSGDVIRGTKYTWICCECGREWLMRQDARRCRHVDFVYYSSRKIFCISQTPLAEASGLEGVRNV